MIDEAKSSNRRVLIKGGTVISVDPKIGDLPNGDVLFEGGKISEVTPDVNAPNAEVIDATDKIVMPGLVDAHRHVWQAAIKGVAPDTDLNDPVGAVVLAAHPRLVDSVFVAGRALKRDGALVGVDAGRVRRLVAESRDRLFAKAGVEIGTGYLPVEQRGKEGREQLW